jgi:hypothetical protein
MYNDKWTNGISEEKAAVLRTLMSDDNFILDRLRELCYNMINELEAQAANFDNPNWAYRQAGIIGEKKALRKIITLCTPAKNSDQSL